VRALGPHYSGVSLTVNTTDPNLRSFVAVPPDGHFPIQNLPYGVFRRRDQELPRVGVAIGDQVLDLAVLERHGFFRAAPLNGETVFDRPTLNAFMALGRPAWTAVRETVSRLLRADEPTLRDDAHLRDTALLPRAGVELLLPVEIGDYTDFYSSREHATNVGTMFRGADNALMPNYLWLPVGYHGRASSVVLSGTDLHRPVGQMKADTAVEPTCGPSRMVDFELEIGALVGPGNSLGQPIPIQAALEHVFGLVLVNDWSARDIQKWEYVPLGPFLAKNFGTSISPWVVPLDALAPFRCAGPAQQPSPLPHLQSPGPASYDLELEVRLQTPRATVPQCICRTNFKYLYWSLPQLVAHHTVNGCNLRTGDLLATGTISGPTPTSYGSLLELAWRGERPINLPSGEQRSFIGDGDRVTLTGWCQGEGYRVGFGECTGRILPALQAG
jgi:fumarylacetoacetase